MIPAGDALTVKFPELPAAMTVSETLVELVKLPEVPVTVIVYLPVAVEEATVMVIVEVPEPGAAIGLVPKPTVTPDGWPVAESVTAPLKAPITVLVIVEDPELPWATETDAGEAERVNPVPVTMSETFVEAVVLPEVPVTVMG